MRLMILFGVFASILPELAIPAAAQGVVIAEDEVAIGRYARVKPQLDERQTEAIRNPLQTVVSVHFPRQEVETVGDAIEYLLLRSGYRLREDSVTEAQQRLTSFPLPEAQRRIEFVTVRRGLELLGGQSYAPNVDHILRTISYELNKSPSIVDAATATHEEAAVSKVASKED